SLLHVYSFPTRRSSDLTASPKVVPIAPNPKPRKLRPSASTRMAGCEVFVTGVCLSNGVEIIHYFALYYYVSSCVYTAPRRNAPRSEEHTSELQSRFDLV